MGNAVAAKHLIPPETLSLEHLLEAVAGNPCVRELAARHELLELAQLSDGELRQRGASRAAARRLATAFELGRRMSQRRLVPGLRLTSSREIFEVYNGRFRGEKREHFISLLIDAKNRLIQEVTVSVGILTASLVHPREVFMPAIRQSAAGIVLLHNHPSGDPEPSEEDHEVTRRLVAAGDLVGIRILDHLVIGNDRYVSFLERGALITR